MRYCPWCAKKNNERDTICAVCRKPLDASNEPHQLMVNTILNNRYQVGVVLRQGGFGITYVGCDTRLEKKVAIKEYYPSNFANRVCAYSKSVSISEGEKSYIYSKELKRFEEEARILALFSGEKNIVNVTDRFSENNTAYMVMEYVEGDDLDVAIKSKGKLSFESAYQLLQPIVKALSRVHKEGLIHRDISPANIKIRPDGTPILLDFGAARSFGEMDEKSYSIILKPGYAPPEQYSLHGNQGTWSDVYAMCATIYRVITGITPPNSMSRQSEDTLKLPSSCGARITPDEEKILMKGLELRPDKRIKSMDELDKKITAAAEYESTEIFSEHESDSFYDNKGSSKKKRHNKKKIRILIGTLGALLIAIVALVVFKLLSEPQSTKQGENTTDADTNIEMLNTAELITGSEVILVGDTTNIKYRLNDINYDYIDGLSYEVSDSNIIQIIKDDNLQQTLIKGISEGTAKIKGIKGNEYGETEITVGSLDKSSNLVLNADLSRIQLYSDDENGVSLRVEITGDVPAKLTANVYNSEGLDLNISGSFDNRILLLNIKDVASRQNNGVLTILVSDGDESSHVIGELEIPIELVF